MLQGGEDNPGWHGAAWHFTVSIHLDMSLEYTVNFAWPLWTDKLKAVAKNTISSGG